MVNPSPPLKTSVRELVEFVLREGDLVAADFVGPDSAQLGAQGHRQLQKSRPDGYEAEVPISCLVETEQLTLDLRGRIDGIFTTSQPVTLEEIKTTTQPLSQIAADPLHWAQAQCYAYMYARQHELTDIRVQLTYYQVDSQEVKLFQRDFTWPQLADFFTSLVTPYLNWFGQVQAWREQRDQAIRQLDFPYLAYRPGQRDMAVAVYRAIHHQGQLFIQAPTGLGKTIAALFPAVKALGQGLVTKIFYLTAKTSGQVVAEQTLAKLRQAGLRLKSVTLTAKEKVCFSPLVDCAPTACPFACNYYGKLKAALAEVQQQDAFTRPVITDLARRYELCPFEFSLDLSLWVDCVIGDYNYAFDPRVYLKRFFNNVREPYLFLIDEAHNLPDRARAMYSAELTKQAVLALRKLVKPHLPNLAKTLTAINQTLLVKRKQVEANAEPALVETELPAALLTALGHFSQQAETWLTQNQPASFRSDLLEFYFQGQTYLRAANFFGPNYVSYFERRGKADLTAKLFCLDPAPLLQTALARSRAAIFFSATLLPLDYFQQVLTGAAASPQMVLCSPFPPENLSLLIHNRVSTRYAHRAGSYDTVTALIETVCAAQPGNYLVFFPSYVYLTEVAQRLQERWPASQLLIQERGMTETARRDFLARFDAARLSSGADSLVGLAVLGGIFGEGIDLVGERLIGAIIVGVGLPQLCLERDLLKDYFDRQQQAGFAYAYQYPGLNRVMQAAGRVIRTEQDRGVIVLIDERLTQSRYTRLFPPEWRHFQVVQTPVELQLKLAHFWQTNW